MTMTVTIMPIVLTEKKVTIAHAMMGTMVMDSTTVQVCVYVVRMCLIHNMVEYTYMYIYYTISLIMIDYWHTVSVEYCFQW